mmetsp:Transcript_1108/g.1114  ORF Transcript_1108/g.1114 Transcript_1108/m.1114 type:complete len:133 (-) Transcript_1108:184-582(-)
MRHKRRFLPQILLLFVKSVAPLIAFPEDVRSLGREEGVLREEARLGGRLEHLVPALIRIKPFFLHLLVKKEVEVILVVVDEGVVHELDGVAQGLHLFLLLHEPPEVEQLVHGLPTLVHPWVPAGLPQFQSFA